LGFIIESQADFFIHIHKPNKFFLF